MIYVPKGTQKKQAYFNKISSKHLDFVCCDPATMEVMFAVELDDASHGRADRVERDKFVDGAMSAAGVPLVRVPAKKGYVVNEVAGMIQAVVV